MSQTLAVMLRGINLGPTNRIKMADLKAAIVEAGIGAGPRTYVQSGNVVLESELAEGELAAAVSALLQRRFSITSPAVVRSAAELAATVAGNPFPDEAASAPKLFQVVFCEKPPAADTEQRLKERASGEEKVALRGREIYSWHPDGIARSKLALGLVPPKVAATARNWTTVNALLEMTSA